MRLFAATLLALLVSLPVAAQTPTREVQLPIDEERGVLEVGPDLRRELGLFPEVVGFQAARLFRQDGGGLILEISRVEDGRLVRERRPVGDGELAAFRQDLGVRFAGRGRTRAVDREGRSGLVLTTTALGLGLYGWAVPVGFDIDGGRGTVAAYLLTAGLSFYLPYRLTRDASVSVAERNAAVWGGTRGALHGVFLGEALGGDDETVALAAMGASVAETVLAYQLARALDASEGEVALMSAAGDLGIPYGLGLSYLGGLFDDEPECDGDVCWSDDFDGSAAGYGASLAIALASPWLAHLSGQGPRYTIGDARALRSFGVLGAQLALPLAWAAFEDDGGDGDKAIAAAVLAGSVAGVWWGDRTLRSRSLSGGDGLLVMAGHVAGGLGALGVTYLLDGGSAEDELLYLATSAVGSAAGALLTLGAVSGGPAPTPGDGDGVSFELAPAGALLPLFGTRTSAPARAPLLTIRF